MELPHLRNFRQRAVMSQDQLAQKSGVARDTISKLETGRRQAYPSTIRKLAGGLEVEPGMLLGSVEYDEDVWQPAETTETEKSGTTGKEGKKIGFRPDE